MNKGFTIIEILIYISITSMILSGALAFALYMVDSNARLDTKLHAIEEVHFVMQKITYLIENADNIVEPAIHATSTSLLLEYESEDIDIFLSDKRVWMRRGNFEPAALTQSRVSIDALVFKRTSSDRLGIEISIEQNTFYKNIWLP